jgi:hypothetical protein
MTKSNFNNRRGSLSEPVSVRNQRHKRVRLGVPRRNQRLVQRDQSRDYIPPEDWHDPVEANAVGYRIITQIPGNGFRHVVTADEVQQRLAELPAWMLNSLDVVQLSRMTRKKLRLPCYGMQWGTALYLYPIEESLEETFCAAPNPSLLIETKMYGGKWTQSGKFWRLTWTEKSIKDYYLNNILIHELGHLLDDRNTSYTDRERFAEWFAIQYGYLPTQRARAGKRKRQQVHRRHHAK